MDNLDDMRNTSNIIVSYCYQLLPNTDFDHLQQVEYICITIYDNGIRFVVK